MLTGRQLRMDREFMDMGGTVMDTLHMGQELPHVACVPQTLHACACGANDMREEVHDAEGNLAECRAAGQLPAGSPAH